MKKTLFSALAVVAIVSAALAFAPAKQFPNIYTFNDDTQQCDLLINFKEDLSSIATINNVAVGTPRVTCPTNTVHISPEN